MGGALTFTCANQEEAEGREAAKDAHKDVAKDHKAGAGQFHTLSTQDASLDTRWLSLARTCGCLFGPPAFKAFTYFQLLLPAFLPYPVLSQRRSRCIVDKKLRYPVWSKAVWHYPGLVTACLKTVAVLLSNFAEHISLQRCNPVAPAFVYQEP